VDGGGVAVCGVVWMKGCEGGGVEVEVEEATIIMLKIFHTTVQN